MKNINQLRRYTDLPALVYFLQRKSITLLNSSSWDDKNDIHYLDLYKKQKGLGSVLAMCFTEAPETYHHWKIFGGGSSGVCIIFKKDKLINSIEKSEPDTKYRLVEYRTLGDMRNSLLNLEDLPYIKRVAFQDEQEFRIIHEAQKEELLSFDIPVSLNCIERIVMNPWIHKKLSDSVKEVISNIEGCGSIKLTRSTLIKNEEWKRFALNPNMRTQVKG